MPLRHAVRNGRACCSGSALSTPAKRAAVGGAQHSPSAWIATARAHANTALRQGAFPADGIFYDMFYGVIGGWGWEKRKKCHRPVNDNAEA